MGYVREVEFSPSFPPFAAFLDGFGFVPGLFRAQTLLPRLIEAEAGTLSALLVEDGDLSRIQKERILLSVAVSQRNPYCAAKAYKMLSLLGDHEQEPDALQNFAAKLVARPTSVSAQDFTELHALAWSDESIQEAVLTAAWGKFECSLATGLGVAPDFAPPPLAPEPVGPSSVTTPEECFGPYLHFAQHDPRDPEVFAFFRDNFGFVPNLYRVQAASPRVLEAEAAAIGAILLSDDALKRVQKERILLAVSAASQNTYCVTMQAAILGLLGINPDEAYCVAEDHSKAGLPEREHALLDFAVKLAAEPGGYSSRNIESLRKQGFSEEQVLEAIATTALAQFLNTVQEGLGPVPDFAPRRSFRRAPENKAHLYSAESRPNIDGEATDPDADLVVKAQGGDLDAFETLVHRNSKRVYRTLLGILGDADEARDAMQDTFLKAFEHLAKFERRSKFSTWLVSVAGNTGLQRLRERRPLDSLEDAGPSVEEGFRPRQVRAWTPDPEELYSRVEMRSLVEKSIMALPAKYRVVVLLCDLEQLPADEAAVALGLGVPALKSRRLRGRLMLREALAPYFAGHPKEVIA